MNQAAPSYLPRRMLRLNVGYLLDGGSQHSKDMEIDLPRVNVADDLNAEHIKGQLRVSRTKEGLLLQGDLSVGVRGDCYRCLTHVERPLSIHIEELYARHDELSEDEAEFQVHEDGQLDLAPLIRAEVLIQTTIGIRCEDTAACTERMKALDDAAGIDNIDPRLAILKDLLDTDE